MPPGSSVRPSAWRPTPSVPCVGVVVPVSASVASVVSRYPGGTVFCLQAGVYRLTRPVVPQAGDTLWGVPGTVLSGARVVSHWHPAGAAWVASGSLPAAYIDAGYNPCQDSAANLCKWDEWLFRDGVELRRVASIAAVTPGTFYADYVANRIYVGDDPAGHQLKLSRTRTAISSTAANVTVRGLTVQMFATANQHGAIVAKGVGWTVRDCHIRFNHGAGIYGYADNLHVLHSRVDYNGTLGIGVYGATGVVVQGNELDHNNTDGSLVNDGENGGYKSTHSSDTVTGNSVHDNNGMGLWFDIDDNGSTITDNTVMGNAADGIRYEISYHATISGNRVTDNGLNRQQGDGSLYYGAGIEISDGNTVDVSDNIVTGNDNGIGAVERNRGSGQYGTWTLTNVNIHDNTIGMTRGLTGLVQSDVAASDFTSQTIHFSNNHYTLDSLARAHYVWLNTTGTPAFWTQNGQDTTGSFRQ